MFTSLYQRIPFRDEARLRSLELNEVTTGEIPQNRYKDLKQRVITNGSIFSTDRDLLNSVDGTVLKKRILLLACEGRGEFSTVTAATVRRLIENGANVDFVDQEWYGWEAIHYAASVSHPAKLQAICDTLGQSRINTLTTLSENALHILLEHCSSALSFEVSCQSGQDLTMSKIINKEIDDVVECARILIDCGIDINHSNFWNETPILVAIKRKYFQVVKLLLLRDDIDLDSCEDAVSGKTAREFLRGKENLGVLPPPCATRDKLLFQLLKSGDEESFLKYNGGKIGDFVKILDGDNEANSSCTLLQYCFRRALIFWHQDKTTNDFDYQFSHQDITASRMVQVFCQNGTAKCFQHLLDNGADADTRLRKFEGGRSLVEAAIIKGFYPLVALILGRQDALGETKILEICQALVDMKPASCADLNNTLSVVLNRLRMGDCHTSVATVEKLKQFVKIRVKDINQDNLLLLFKFPGFLSCDQTCKTILEDIDPDILNAHLDDCVEQNTINYDSFLHNSNVRSVFQTFLSDGLQHFLNHIVFKILIYRQWKHLRLPWRWCHLTYFNLNLAFYLIFCALLNSYILFKFNDKSAMFLYIPGVIFLCIFIAKEVFQMMANYRVYFVEYTNYPELALITCAIMVYFTNADWIDVVEVLAVLISNLVLLLLLFNMPACSRYIIILKTMVYYLQYIGFYFIQFVAFGICFYILFAQKDHNVFTELPNKIFETVILFTGNLDYMDTPWKDENKCKNSTNADLHHDFPNKQVFSKIVFIIFVLFMAVILQNLLLGLLVIDLSDLHKDVALSEQVKRASFVVRLDTFFNSPFMRSPYIRKFLRYEELDAIRIIVDDHDRKLLNDKEKQTLDFMSTKKTKKPNVLKKLRDYIRMRIKERVCDQRDEKDKEIVEKLGLLEEMIKNLHL